MALDQAALHKLTLLAESEDPLSYAEAKELQSVYYELRHESEQILSGCGEDEAGAQTILMALHGYEHSQIPEPAFLTAVADADSGSGASQEISCALRSHIAFRLAFCAYFHHRLTGETDPASTHRLTLSFLYQLCALNTYLADYRQVRQSATEPAGLSGAPLLNPPSTPASLLQTRLEL
ncbi:MAG TPA: hypothetical protein VFW40_11455 [Capsulimonadaceae bacterium]|nr:hypothetical protein [Capsulimonadaceae bacterium]